MIQVVFWKGASDCLIFVHWSDGMILQVKENIIKTVLNHAVVSSKYCKGIQFFLCISFIAKKTCSWLAVMQSNWGSTKHIKDVSINCQFLYKIQNRSVLFCSSLVDLTDTTVHPHHTLHGIPHLHLENVLYYISPPMVCINTKTKNAWQQWENQLLESPHSNGAECVCVCVLVVSVLCCVAETDYLQ